MFRILLKTSLFSSPLDTAVRSGKRVWKKSPSIDLSYLDDDSYNFPIPYELIEELEKQDAMAALSKPPPLMDTHRANIDAAIKRWQVHPKDVGSSEVQIAVAHERIKYLTTHLLKNKKDHASKRGLQALVTLRRKNLNYLYHQDAEKATAMATALGIRFHPPGQHLWDKAVKYAGFKNTKNRKAEALKLAKKKLRLQSLATSSL